MREVNLPNPVDYDNLERAIASAAKDFNWKADVSEHYHNYMYYESREPGVRSKTPIYLGMLIQLGRFKKLPAMSIFLVPSGDIRNIYVDRFPPYGFCSDRKVNRYLDAVYRYLESKI